MKKIDATKWPLACTSILLMIYIIIIENKLIHYPSAASIIICVILSAMTIGNIFFFEDDSEWRRHIIFGKHIVVKNDKIFILIGIVAVLFVLFVLSNKKYMYIPYVYLVATFYCASLIRIKLGKHNY